MKVASGLDDGHKMNQELFISVINLCNKHHLQKCMCLPMGTQLLKVIWYSLSFLLLLDHAFHHCYSTAFPKFIILVLGIWISYTA